MYCGYHHRQAPCRLFDTRCRACGAGPYFFDRPNVGFFCQQHKHVSHGGEACGQMLPAQYT